MLKGYAGIGLAAGLIGLFVVSVLSVLNSSRILRRLRSQHARTFPEARWSMFLFERQSESQPRFADFLQSEGYRALGDEGLTRLCQRQKRLNRAAILLFALGAFSLMYAVTERGS